MLEEVAGAYHGQKSGYLRWIGMGRAQLKPGASRWVSACKMWSEAALGFVLFKGSTPGALVGCQSVSGRQLGADIGALWLQRRSVGTPSERGGFSRYPSPRPLLGGGRAAAVLPAALLVPADRKHSPAKGPRGLLGASFETLIHTGAF